MAHLNQHPQSIYFSFEETVYRYHPMDFWKILETDLLEIQRTELILSKTGTQLQYFFALLDVSPAMAEAPEHCQSGMGASDFHHPQGSLRCQTSESTPPAILLVVAAWKMLAYRLAYMGTEGSRYLYIYIYTQYTYDHMITYVYISCAYIDIMDTLYS